MAQKPQKMVRAARCVMRKNRNLSRRADARKAAEARQAVRDKRSAAEQLAILDERRGESKRERQRLSLAK